MLARINIVLWKIGCLDSLEELYLSYFFSTEMKVYTIIPTKFKHFENLRVIMVMYQAGRTTKYLNCLQKDLCIIILVVVMKLETQVLCWKIPKQSS